MSHRAWASEIVSMVSSFRKWACRASSFSFSVFACLSCSMSRSWAVYLAVCLILRKFWCPSTAFLRWSLAAIWPAHPGMQAMIIMAVICFIGFLLWSDGEQDSEHICCAFDVGQFSCAACYN